MPVVDIISSSDTAPGRKYTVKIKFLFFFCLFRKIPILRSCVLFYLLSNQVVIWTCNKNSFYDNFKIHYLQDCFNFLRAHHGESNINWRNSAQTVGSFGRNVFGTDLVGIQAQHSQLGEFSHVGHIATETAQGELWKSQKGAERGHSLSQCN